MSPPAGYASASAIVSGVDYEFRFLISDFTDSLEKTIGLSLMIQSIAAEALATRIADEWNVPAQLVDGQIRLEQPDGQCWIARLMDAFGDQIDAITLGKPTLGDVFIAKTGHRFWSENEQGETAEAATK